MAVHELKTWPEYFSEVRNGNKRFEIRKHDRDFNVGDILRLKEFEPMRSTLSDPNDGFSGEEMDVQVTYILPGPAFGIEEGNVVMSIIPVN